MKDFRAVSEENGKVPVIFGGDFNLQHASAKEGFEIATDDGEYGHHRGGRMAWWQGVGESQVKHEEVHQPGAWVVVSEGL